MGGLFDISKKKEELLSLENEMNTLNFWDDQNKANNICQKVSNLKKEINEYDELDSDISSLLELIDISDEEDINKEYNNILNKYKEFSKKIYLSGEYDSLNCYLDIHPGAGGTESCDWSSMLLEMYEKYCDLKGYKYEVINLQKGEEAGIKSATLYITGLYAYGYLKNEQGVHRLVRISPFDSNKRRHTSFASVSVTPEFDDNIDIEVKEEDLKIDVYHSSGAGGQSVNTSNSAVRITHIPSKIVVTCQTERSQLLNKDKAIHLLKNKLYQIELEKNQAKLNEVKDSSSINFGSQIRSYVLEPYKLVKDHRTGFESTQPEKVFNGEIEGFIESNLYK